MRTWIFHAIAAAASLAGAVSSYFGGHTELAALFTANTTLFVALVLYARRSARPTGERA